MGILTFGKMVSKWSEDGQTGDSDIEQNGVKMEGGRADWGF